MTFTAYGGHVHTRVRLAHDAAGAPLLWCERRLAHPVERVWHALTDEVELAAWYPTRDDVLCWELTPEGAGTRLLLANRVASAAHTPYTAAGFDLSLGQLATLLDEGAGRVRRIEMPPPDALVARYARALSSSWSA